MFENTNDELIAAHACGRSPLHTTHRYKTPLHILRTYLLTRLYTTTRTITTYLVCSIVRCNCVFSIGQSIEQNPAARGWCLDCRDGSIARILSISGMYNVLTHIQLISLSYTIPFVSTKYKYISTCYLPFVSSSYIHP